MGDSRLCDECEKVPAEVTCAECEIDFCVACCDDVHKTSKILMRHTRIPMEKKAEAGQCEECVEATATVWCSSCEMPYCDACCTSVHSSSKALRKHTPKPLADGATSNSEAGGEDGSEDASDGGASSGSARDGDAEGEAAPEKDDKQKREEAWQRQAAPKRKRELIPEGIIREGELAKYKGGRFNAWDKRWFVLTKAGITYHPSKEKKNDVRGTLPFVEVEYVRATAIEAVAKKGLFAFDLGMIDGGRVYTLQASKREDSIAWLKDINKVMENQDTPTDKAKYLALKSKTEGFEILDDDDEDRVILYEDSCKKIRPGDRVEDVFLHLCDDVVVVVKENKKKLEFVSLTPIAQLFMSRDTDLLKEHEAERDVCLELGSEEEEHWIACFADANKSELFENLVHWSKRRMGLFRACGSPDEDMACEWINDVLEESVVQNVLDLLDGVVLVRLIASVTAVDVKKFDTFTTEPKTTADMMVNLNVAWKKIGEEGIRRTAEAQSFLGAHPAALWQTVMDIRAHINGAAPESAHKSVSLDTSVLDAIGSAGGSPAEVARASMRPMSFVVEDNVYFEEPWELSADFARAEAFVPIFGPDHAEEELDSFMDLTEFVVLQADEKAVDEFQRREADMALKELEDIVGSTNALMATAAKEVEKEKEEKARRAREEGMRSRAPPNSAANTPASLGERQQSTSDVSDTTRATTSEGTSGDCVLEKYGDDDVILQGMLFKLKGVSYGMGKWDRRWVVLTPRALSYYPSKDRLDDCRGTIDLILVQEVRASKNVSASKKNLFAFDLVTEGRVFTFHDESHGASVKWLKAVQRFVRGDAKSRSMSRRGTNRQSGLMISGPTIAADEGAALVKAAPPPLETMLDGWWDESDDDDESGQNAEARAAYLDLESRVINLEEGLADRPDVDSSREVLRYDVVNKVSSKGKKQLRTFYVCSDCIIYTKKAKGKKNVDKLEICGVVAYPDMELNPCSWDPKSKLAKDKALNEKCAIDLYRKDKHKAYVLQFPDLRPKEAFWELVASLKDDFDVGALRGRSRSTHRQRGGMEETSDDSSASAMGEFGLVDSGGANVTWE